MADPIDVPSSVILNLLCGACPERHVEIKRLWESAAPQFALKPDRADRLDMSAHRNKVSWMQKTLEHDWVIAFAGFKALSAYSPHILLANREISMASLDADDGLLAAESEVDDLLYFATEIRATSDSELLDWPLKIPRPGTDRDSLASNEDKVCFDIACLAAAATFLHELKHVMFAAESNAPEVRVDEERACDDFSRNMLLEKVGDYAPQGQGDTETVASKRVIGLASAALAIAQAERHNMASATQDTHPSIRERFLHLVLEADVADNATCWTYTAALLIALLRKAGKLPNKVEFDSPKHLCQQLVVHL